MVVNVRVAMVIFPPDAACVKGYLHPNLTTQKHSQLLTLVSGMELITLVSIYRRWPDMLTCLLE